MLNLFTFLQISLVLFTLGICGILLNRKNIILILMSIELMLLAINLNFIFFSIFIDDIVGQIFSLFILTIAAAESAIGLAILIIYYRIRGTIAISYLNILKG